MTKIAWNTSYLPLVGSIDGAVFLSQLVYWQKTMKGRWFYKTGESWQQEIGLSRYRRESLCKQFKALGLLQTKKAGIHGRTYYHVDLEQLKQCLHTLAEQLPHDRLGKEVFIAVDEAGNVYQADVDNTIEPTQQEPDAAKSHEKLAKSTATERQGSSSLTNQENEKITKRFATQSQRSLLESSEALCYPVTKVFATEQPTHINKINTKITHKINTEINTNNIVESQQSTTSQLDCRQDVGNLCSATEPPTNQPALSGNSPPAARRGGDEAESLNQSSQLAKADDVAHQEAKHDVGTQHLQTIKENLALAKKSDDRVADIFNHWQTVLHHPHAKLDEKRKRLIKNALKMGYSDQDLKQAITGCSQTPHNLGDNDRGQRYDGLHIILRDADQIDRFMANAINPPRKLNAQEQLEIDNKRIADEYLRSQGLTPVGEETIINHGEL